MTIDTVPDDVLRPPVANSPVVAGGVIKAQPEDFRVEEIPAYDPSGSGEHLFLRIRKRNLSAGRLIDTLAKNLAIPARDIGVAGQKDQRAVTEQFVSVPNRCRSRLSSLTDGCLQILSVTSSSSKLRTGHLKGNRFRIVLRHPRDEDFTANDLRHVQERLQQLAEFGFPNYFGSQRFGHNGHTLKLGLQQLAQAATQSGRRSRFLKKLSISAVQSAVFNRVLAARVRDDTFRQPMIGDVVCRRDGIRPFVFNEDCRTDAALLVPMGPMPGPKMVAAQGDPANLEAQVLTDWNLTPDVFAARPKQSPGTRRRMVVCPEDIGAALTDSGDLEMQFVLPAGTYATVLLRELCDFETFSGTSHDSNTGHHAR